MIFIYFMADENKTEINGTDLFIQLLATINTKNYQTI